MVTLKWRAWLISPLVDLHPELLPNSRKPTALDVFNDIDDKPLKKFQRSIEIDFQIPSQESSFVIKFVTSHLAISFLIILISSSWIKLSIHHFFVTLNILETRSRHSNTYQSLDGTFCIRSQHLLTAFMTGMISKEGPNNPRRHNGITARCSGLFNYPGG